MKKILVGISVVLFTMLFFSCPSELPDDPFFSIDATKVLAECQNLKSNGGFEGKDYLLQLTFSAEEKNNIKAIEWKLTNSLGEQLLYRVDTVGEEGEWKSDSFSIHTGSLPIENYRLVATIYDSFSREGEMIVLENVKNKRSFVVEFVLDRTPSLSGLYVRSLGAGQDTGYSNSDRITRVNQNLTFHGETLLEEAITDNPSARCYFVLAKRDGLEQKTSPDLTPTLGTEPNSKLWAWTCTDLLTDGFWNVELHFEYTNSSSELVNSVNEDSFIVAIDTTPPQVFWAYKKEGDKLIRNKEQNQTLPLDSMIEVPFALSYDFDVYKNDLIDAKKLYQRWMEVALVDMTPAVHSGDPSDHFYTGANFTPTQGGDWKGFDFMHAGVQEIEAVAWDAAGNKSSNTIKRRVKIADPIVRRNFVNGDFSSKPGVSGYTDISNPVNAEYSGWKSKIFWLEYWGGKAYEKVSEDNPPQIATEGWNYYFNCFVKNHEGNPCLNFVEYYKNTTWVGRYMLSTGGKVYQEFHLYDGVKYAFIGKSANGDVKNPNEPSALFVEHSDVGVAPVFTGNGKTGGFPFSIDESNKEGDHIYYKPFEMKNGQMETQTLEFVAPSVGVYNLGFAKKMYNMSGNNGSGWTLCDDASLAITDWPKAPPLP